MSTRRRSRFCKSKTIRSICDVGGSDRIHSKEAAGGNVGFISCKSAVPAGVASTKPTSPTGCDGCDRLSKKMSLYREKEWYFFTPRDRKYQMILVQTSAAGTGYWNVTGAHKPVGKPKT
ncbi:unnamed protein product [Brassica rapa]|uniref:NAC domain-containing protein n=2 Tax=Brassica TaxID=3705 RepID=A0A8D9CYY7_BRACM|nr:unnamed protein product [Brassica napus]CAG7864042.1 unnamed protein product [Brassica rapa]